MDDMTGRGLDRFRADHPEKFKPTDQVFSRIHRGDRIFIGTACGEPQHLVRSLTEYVESHPKAFFDAEVLHVWTLGVAPYTDEKFRSNFRHNSFFIGDNTRDSVNSGMADYTPIFLSNIPGLFNKKMVPIDVALIQTSMPDINGYMSLGLSVDITKAAVANAELVIAQVNPRMPRVHGDSFIHIDDVDFLVEHEEPLLEYEADISDEIVKAIGRHVAQLIEDGDTIQVGYGSLPNAILKSLGDRRDLGVHTELISDGIAELMRTGVVNNSKKTVNRGKTVATFCMGRKSTYEFIHDNPAIRFEPVDYTNDPRIISQHDNMVAINSALQIDLTGQATAESIGHLFYSGIGGQADFMRGAVLSRGGKTILAMQATAEGGATSRIVPFIQEGAGVTLTRGDIHYVVTEYGIAYLHGKNIRERAMSLIAIAHPDHRMELIDKAKELNLIYKDQAFIPGKKGEYPQDMETYRTTGEGTEVFIRPVKISDEPALKDFFYDLSDNSMYRRFMSLRKDMPHERLQEFVAIDWTREVVVLAVMEEGDVERVVGLGQYGILDNNRSAEVAMVVRDGYQNRGIGSELLRYMTVLAKRQGLQGFTAEVLVENRPMLHVFEKMGFDIDRQFDADVYELRMTFREN